MRIPRLTDWMLITICLVLAIALIQPQQLQVVVYKACLVALGGVIAYWIDRRMFPYARPHEMVKRYTKAVSRADEDGAIGHGLVASLAMIRRAIVVLACILGLTLAL